MKRSTVLALEWGGAILSIIGASLLALNISISPWAYVVYTASSLLLLAWALQQKAYGIVAQNSIFTLINIVGIYRWLL
ncbi:MAG: hypothetical protein KAH22_03205 [Thiotrichaceae bacterium]|nr:hypothetical protein [Thiotrichaceae bacterium]